MKEMQETYDNTDEDTTDSAAPATADPDLNQENNGGNGSEGDSKWRPLLLTLGVLYKLQRIRDSNHASW